MDLTSAASIKRLIYLFLVTVTAFIIQIHLDNSQSHWLVWSALLLSLITTGNTFWQRISIIALAGIVLCLIVFISGMVSALIIVFSLYLFVLTCALVYAGQAHSKYFYIFFIINLFAILSISYLSISQENIARSEYVLFGAAIVMCFQFIFLPYFKRDECSAYTKITLQNLRLLSNEIFSCFISPEYIDNVYLFERRVHHAKSKYFASISRLREVGVSENKFLSYLEWWHDNLIDCAQLRRRVIDHATLSVCRDEMTLVAQNIENIFSALQRRQQKIDTQDLNISINRLDDNYQHVVKIASREPLVFLLLIESLRSLSESFDQLNSVEVNQWCN